MCQCEYGRIDASALIYDVYYIYTITYKYTKRLLHLYIPNYVKDTVYISFIYRLTRVYIYIYTHIHMYLYILLYNIVCIYIYIITYHLYLYMHGYRLCSYLGQMSKESDIVSNQI